jgi:predicted MPP superfamily phosphohydrolase
LYIYLKLRSGFGGGRWGVAYLLWAAVWAVAPFVSRFDFFDLGRASEVLFALSFTWAAIVFMACVGFFFMDAAALAAAFIDRLAGSALKPTFFAPRRCVPVTLFLIAAAVLYSFYEAWDVRRVDLVIEAENLPVPSLRVVHLTDVHLGGVYTAGRLRKVMDIVRSAEPDLLAVTGDLVDGDMSFRDEEARLLSSHGARYGAYAVTGNHEFYAGIDEAEDFMRRAGLVLLRDARADAAGITIIGVDDAAKYGQGMSEQGKISSKIFSYFPEDRFVLLLKHRPQVIEGTEGKFGLQLSGHTHGGQIWPFSYVARWVNKSVQHLSRIGSSAVYVSNGAGFWGPPMRFLVPPEVTVIELRRVS